MKYTNIIYKITVALIIPCKNSSKIEKKIIGVHIPGQLGFDSFITVQFYDVCK